MNIFPVHAYNEDGCPSEGTPSVNGVICKGWCCQDTLGYSGVPSCPQLSWAQAVQSPTVKLPRVTPCAALTWPLMRGCPCHLGRICDNLYLSDGFSVLQVKPEHVYLQQRLCRTGSPSIACHPALLNPQQNNC